MTAAAVGEARTPLGATLALSDLARDPFGTLALLRAREPVSWIAADSVWLIATHPLVDEAHRDQQRFITDLEGSEVRQLFGTTMLTVDGPAHRIHNAPFAAPLRRRVAETAYGPLIRALAEEAIAKLPPGGADLVAQLAHPLALRLVGTVLGFDAAGADAIEQLVAAMALADGIAVPEDVRRRAARARKRFGVHVRAALAASEGGSSGSVLSAVARTRSPQLTDRLLVDNTINMIFGAVDPTAILIGTALWALLAHPSQLEAVKADRALLPAAVKEAARWHSPFAASVRYVGVDTVFHGTPMGAGEKVYLMILSANRDEHVFRDPEHYDIARADLKLSIAFGRGLHFCVGEALAEIAAREAIDVALSRLANLRLDPARPSEPRGVDHHQLERLDVLYGS